jgi:hypothetical protein
MEIKLSEKKAIQFENMKKERLPFLQEKKHGYSSPLEYSSAAYITKMPC